MASAVFSTSGSPGSAPPSTSSRTPQQEFDTHFDKLKTNFAQLANPFLSSLIIQKLEEVGDSVWDVPEKPLANFFDANMPPATYELITTLSSFITSTYRRLNSAGSATPFIEHCKECFKGPLTGSEQDRISQFMGAHSSLKELLSDPIALKWDHAKVEEMIACIYKDDRESWESWLKSQNLEQPEYKDIVPKKGRLFSISTDLEKYSGLFQLSRHYKNGDRFFSNDYDIDWELGEKIKQLSNLNILSKMKCSDDEIIKQAFRVLCYKKCSSLLSESTRKLKWVKSVETLAKAILNESQRHNGIKVWTDFFGKKDSLEKQLRELQDKLNIKKMPDDFGFKELNDADGKDLLAPFLRELESVSHTDVLSLSPLLGAFSKPDLVQKRCSTQAELAALSNKESVAYAKLDRIKKKEAKSTTVNFFTFGKVKRDLKKKLDKAQADSQKIDNQFNEIEEELKKLTKNQIGAIKKQLDSDLSKLIEAFQQLEWLNILIKIEYSTLKIIREYAESHQEDKEMDAFLKFKHS